MYSVEYREEKTLPQGSKVKLVLQIILHINSSVGACVSCAPEVRFV